MIVVNVITDRFFHSSPDAGHWRCICSRCGSKIKGNEVPVRCYTLNKNGIIDKYSKEYRFCETCQTNTKEKLTPEFDPQEVLIEANP